MKISEMFGKTTFDFGKQLGFSETRDIVAAVQEYLLANIPGAVSVEKLEQIGDDHGTDYWVYREGRRRLSIDVKVRDHDCRRFGDDDVALETWSDIDNRIGWSRDDSKETDLVLWYWKDTGRMLMRSFLSVQWVFAQYWESWYEQFKHDNQTNTSWTSQCVFVPVCVLDSTIKAELGDSLMLVYDGPWRQ